MKSNLKLSILTSSDFPYGMAMESFVRQLSLGLHANDIELEVIRLFGNRLNTINDTGIKRSDYLFKKPFKNELFKFFEVIFQVLFIPFFIINRKIFKREQIIIMYGLDRAYFVFPTTIIGRLFGLKIFRVNTEVYPAHTYANKWWRRPLVLFNELQIKYFDQYLNGIIVLSHFLKNMAIANGVDEKKILLVPHFINLDSKKIDRSCFDDKLTHRVGYCGDPSIENGIMDLIDAFLILNEISKNEVELLIIGEINPAVKNEISNRSLKNIIFTGKLTSSEVSNELQKCSILVNPRRLGISADSGFPTKIGEYFAVNKTVVSTKVGDLSIYFKDKREVIFAEPNNPISLFNSISFALENQEIALEIAQRGHQWACGNLEYINNSKKLIDFVSNS